MSELAQGEENRESEANQRISKRVGHRGGRDWPSAQRWLCLRQVSFIKRDPNPKPYDQNYEYEKWSK